MSEHVQEQEQPHNLDMHYARKNGPLSPEQRLKKQIRFIASYRKTGNIKHSCEYAGISRQTFYGWRDNDTIFAAHLAESEKDADDTLEYAGYDRAVTGVPSYVVSQGRIVYEEIPDLDESGEPKLDKHGNPIMKRGKPLIERKYSDSLLTTLLKARMPQKYNRQQLEVSGPDGKPIQYELVERLANLPPEQLDLIEQASRIVDEAVKNGD